MYIVQTSYLYYNTCEYLIVYMRDDIILHHSLECDRYVKTEKESLHYPFFMVEALMKLHYWWKFKIGRIILVILFLEFLAL